MMNETVLTFVVRHEKPVPWLAEMLIGRACTIPGVQGVERVSGSLDTSEVRELQRHGFSLAEISLGVGDVERN